MNSIPLQGLAGILILSAIQKVTQLYITTLVSTLSSTAGLMLKLLKINLLTGAAIFYGGHSQITLESKKRS